MPRRIGDIARAAGVGVETVRFYEREGLIDRPEKPLRGWRDYDDLALLQLNQIRLARQFGLTLGDAKAIRKRAKGPEPQFCGHVRETLAARLAAIDTEITRLKARRKALRWWLSECEKRAKAPGCPLYAKLREGKKG